MTCIVGLIDNGRVYIGGDSAGVGSNNSLTIRADSKVFKNGNFAFGFTTSFRMGQLLRYAFVPPEYHEDSDLMHYMVNNFIDAIRECFKKGGYASKLNEVETAGIFLVGFRGRLFYIDNDYQIGESCNDYYTCGCGSDIANGSLFTTKKENSLININPKDRILIALKSAENHSVGVRGPFTIISV